LFSPWAACFAKLPPRPQGIGLHLCLSISTLNAGNILSPSIGKLARKAEASFGVLLGEANCHLFYHVTRNDSSPTTQSSRHGAAFTAARNPEAALLTGVPWALGRQGCLIGRRVLCAGRPGLSTCRASAAGRSARRSRNLASMMVSAGASPSRPPNAEVGTRRLEVSVPSS
jgi:hypothetical protein